MIRRLLPDLDAALQVAVELVVENKGRALMDWKGTAPIRCYGDDHAATSTAVLEAYPDQGMVVWDNNRRLLWIMRDGRLIANLRYKTPYTALPMLSDLLTFWTLERWPRHPTLEVRV